MKTTNPTPWLGPLATGSCLLALATAGATLAACGVAAKPIPAAISHDAGLEAEAMRAYPGLKDTLGMTPGGTPIEARIVGGWNVIQNEYTGAPTERTIDIVVAAKEDDGTCSWTSGRFSQKHMGGGSYGELHPQFQLDKGGIDCKSLDGDGPSEKAAAPVAAGGIGVVGAEPGAPAATETDAEYAAKVETIAESLGPDAVPECKTYIREACKLQTGPTRVTVCKTYADSIRPTASSSQGSIVCKAAADGLAAR